MWKILRVSFRRRNGAGIDGRCWQKSCSIGAGCCDGLKVKGTGGVSWKGAQGKMEAKVSGLAKYEVEGGRKGVVARASRRVDHLGE